MNVAGAIELALSRTVAEYGSVPYGTALRPWQTPAEDPTWNEAGDRTFPLVEFRCAPPTFDDNQSTLQSSCAVLIGEIASDDRDRARISLIYERIYAVVYALFKQFRTGVNGNEKELFESQMGALVDASEYVFGGFSIAEPLAPYEADGKNYIGVSLVVHYSNADF